MEYLDALTEIKNNLISEINTNNLDYSEINIQFQKYDLKMNDEIDLLSSTILFLKKDFINMILSFSGVGLGNLAKNDVVYIPSIVLSVATITMFAKDAIDYKKHTNLYAEIENNINMKKIEGRILKIKKEILEKELNKINIAIDFLNSLTEEEKVKYLKVN